MSRIEPTLCDLGVGAPELGYVSLSEMVTVRGPSGLPIELDRRFLARKPLSEYAQDARVLGNDTLSSPETSVGGLRAAVFDPVVAVHMASRPPNTCRRLQSNRTS